MEKQRSRPVISLLTDFGHGGGYTGAMKGVMISRSEAEIVDITHDVPPQSVIAGAFILKSVAGFFPPGTIHVAVVDPGVGGKRRPIAIKAGKYYFVGPDNGVLIPAGRESGKLEVREIDPKRLDSGTISSTFHGRDIFAPAAALLASGLPFEKIGRLTGKFVDLDFGHVRRTGDSVSGVVLYHDSFGNLITNIPADTFSSIFRTGDKVLSSIGDITRTLDFAATYDTVPPGTALLLKGSHGNIEIAVNRGSARHIFDVSDNADVSFKKIRL